VVAQRSTNFIKFMKNDSSVSKSILYSFKRNVITIVLHHILMMLKKLLFGHVDVILPSMIKSNDLFFRKILFWKSVVFVYSFSKFSKSRSMLFIKSLFNPLYPNPVNTTFLSPWLIFNLFFFDVFWNLNIFENISLYFQLSFKIELVSNHILVNNIALKIRKWNGNAMT